MWGMGSVGWYRTWSDKWLEQGNNGTLTTNESSTGTVVNLVKVYANSSYNVLISNRNSSATNRRWSHGYAMNKSQIKVFSSFGDTQYSSTPFSYTCNGYTS